MKSGLQFTLNNDLEPYRSESWAVSSVVFRKKSQFQLIEVIEFLKIGKTLLLDGCIQFSEYDEAHYHELFVHPACFVVSPQKVLVLGGGDGGCVRELLRHESIKTVIVCEIDEDVITTCKEYFPQVSNGLEDSKVCVIIGDALDFVKNYVSTEKFDLILLDLTDLGELSANLYSSSFFEKLKLLLSSRGLIVIQTSGIYYLGVEPFNLGKFNASLRQIFRYVRVSYVPIFSYPGAENSFTYCSDFVDLASYRFSSLPEPSFKDQLTFYTHAYAEACFVLPKRLAKLYA
ncbi:MAG: spermidine synthase [Deltaproteobacteria bacterium]|nr:spermidine synthase [Deltaproteobacteria bacterium]